MSMSRQRGMPIKIEHSAQCPGDETADPGHHTDCGKETLSGRIESNVRPLKIRKQRCRADQQDSCRNQYMPAPV